MFYPSRRIIFINLVSFHRYVSFAKYLLNKNTGNSQLLPCAATTITQDFYFVKVFVKCKNKQLRY